VASYKAAAVQLHRLLSSAFKSDDLMELQRCRMLIYDAKQLLK
jgi:hypothetical protein